MAENSLTQNRKADHIRLALAQQQTERVNDYDAVEFVHHALDAVNTADVNIATEIAGSVWSHPFYINAMTGGTEQAGQINQKLALACAATGTAIAAGSLGVALDNPETAPSFQVLRKHNPHGFIFANIGAGRGLADARRAVELLEANALQIHVNAVQETVMAEGDTDFSRWLENIETIVNGLSLDNVPVVVKEVGFGLSRRTLEKLSEIGVQIADVSGTGGTNFAQIEADRRGDDYGYLNSFGQSAVCALLDAPEFPCLLASGGVRNPLDVVKLLALGADAVGVAGRFLRTVVDAEHTALIAQLEWWQARVTELFALLGAHNYKQLRQTDVLLRGRVFEYCKLRGLDASLYAKRAGNTQHGQGVK